MSLLPTTSRGRGRELHLWRVEYTWVNNKNGSRKGTSSSFAYLLKIHTLSLQDGSGGSVAGFCEEVCFNTTVPLCCHSQFWSHSGYSASAPHFSFFPSWTSCLVCAQNRPDAEPKAAGCAPGAGARLARISLINSDERHRLWPELKERKIREELSGTLNRNWNSPTG